MLSIKSVTSSARATDRIQVPRFLNQCCAPNSYLESIMLTRPSENALIDSIGQKQTLKGVGMSASAITRSRRLRHQAVRGAAELGLKRPTGFPRPISLTGFVLLPCGSGLGGGRPSLVGCRRLASRGAALACLCCPLTGCELPSSYCHRRLRLRRGDFDCAKTPPSPA